MSSSDELGFVRPPACFGARRGADKLEAEVPRSVYSVMRHDQDDFDFDDPGLKAAVRRAWGEDAAPQRLRGRISHLIATAASMDHSADLPAPQPGWQIWASRAYAIAAAAVLIFAIGLLALYYQGAINIGPGNPIARAQAVSLVPTRTEVPVQVMRSLLATHVACARLPDHHLIDRAVGAKSYSELSLKLTADLGFPVVARRIGGEDWKFLGAGECDVAGTRAAHLLFGKGNDIVSVFSLPSDCMSGCAVGAQFDGMYQGHPVAGFARSGASYALMGSSPSGALSAQSLASMRDALFGTFSVEGCGEGTGGLDLLDE
jgi:hypothetical protein